MYVTLQLCVKHINTQYLGLAQAGDVVKYVLRNASLGKTLKYMFHEQHPGIGDIRLSSSCSGNLEVYVNSLTYGKQWYQVCDRGMSDTEARVICRQLGCPTTYATATQAR